MEIRRGTLGILELDVIGGFWKRGAAVVGCDSWRH